MKGSVTLGLIVAALFSSVSQAADVKSCSDLSGRWETTAGDQHLVLNISPSAEACGTNCVTLELKYNLDETRVNKAYCHEGVEGIKGQGPMVISFEGVYGGHSIGTYNRQLDVLWAGVIPKDSKGNWETKMDNYWFKRVGN
ncbi:hypothetical protein [Pseudomonas syringae]|uniref:hypothetical protein n=1 Tax=Pseudomonas syringae TaxID=317 RepID=UPI0002A7AF8F|nr:hypothetical protein [Pseudomonas syringae]ELP96920.1 hypothetical protein A979_21631 [Pseudomonas syringae BRIP34876]ELQ00046.1 hypothetical protein A987_17837 [Pseudomonas syringae BRIP34881]PHN51685.1 hypothetical protein AO254_23120 [Pseudomonas syringae]RMM60662.1 putative secreted protein [Pseudomonas syringae pv. atrofaciens]UZS70613.1 hypothetical protein OQB66_13430 [Pseudomonas syringae]